MAQDKYRDPRNREKQKAHGAQGEQGGRPAVDEASKPEPTVYQGPEEHKQQRRS